jgi:hypothetical protein
MIRIDHTNIYPVTQAKDPLINEIPDIDIRESIEINAGKVSVTRSDDNWSQLAIRSLPELMIFDISFLNRY